MERARRERFGEVRARVRNEARPAIDERRSGRKRREVCHGRDHAGGEVRERASEERALGEERALEKSARWRRELKRAQEERRSGQKRASESGIGYRERDFLGGARARRLTNIVIAGAKQGRSDVVVEQCSAQ